MKTSGSGKHFHGLVEYNKNRRIPDEEVFVENSTYQRVKLKARIMKQELLPNKCAICGIDPEWNGNKLVMVLDHINGVCNDNRLENLRLICPNCNSQTDTFSGKRKPYKKMLGGGATGSADDSES